MAQLLLTRSREQNAALLNKIQRPDIPLFEVSLLEPRSLPLTEAGKACILQLDQYDDIIFISKNAVAYGMAQLEEYWPQWPLNLKWLAVGQATGAALAAYDLPVVFPAEASSEGLLKLSQLAEVREHRILIVRGKGGRETLKEGLLARGAKVEYLEVYERIELEYPATAFPSGDDVIALVYSGEGLQHLANLIGTTAYNYTLIVPSARLQELAISAGFAKVEVANNQEDESMIDVLATILGSMA